MSKFAITKGSLIEGRLFRAIAVFVVMAWLLAGPHSLQSQALIDQLPISGNWALMGDFFVDEEGNYIYVQEVQFADEGIRPIPLY